MKKTGLLLFLLAGLMGCWIAYHHTQSTPAAAPGTVPGGPEEEGGEIRAAWERHRYADPATGEIPPGISFQERQFAAGLPKAAADRSGGPWTSRGPYNVGGRTRGLAIDVADENHLLAGGVSGGLWSSNDGGQSWTRRTPLDAHPGVASIAQDTRPGKTNTWYYLSGELYGTSASATGAFYLGDGLFKSTDNGQSWAPLASTALGNPNSLTTVYQTGWRVVTSPVDSLDVVYFACYGGIFRSADGGNTWAVARGTTTLASASYYTDVAVSATGVLYATLSSEGVHKGIWRSTNGTQWTNITPANFPGTYQRLVIGINPNNENEVYFLGYTPNSGLFNAYLGSNDWSSLWKYTYLGGDGAGANAQWENRSMNLPGVGTEFDRFALQSGYDLVVKVQPGTNDVFVGGTSLWRSTDGFATPGNTMQIAGYKPGTDLPFFERYPNHHPDQHEILFLPSNPKVALTASDGGLHRTEDCNADTVVWTSLNNGYQTTQFWTIAVDQNKAGDNTILGGLQDNDMLFVNHADPQHPWTSTFVSDGAYAAIPAGQPYYILSFRSGGAVVVKCALDANGNVTAFHRFDPTGPADADYLFINPMALDPVDQNILYLPAGKHLYRQNDLASIPLDNVWQTSAQGWTLFPDSAFSTIGAISVSRANPAHRVYIGTDARRIYRIDSANTGTPAIVQTSLPSVAANANVSCIAIDPDNADRIVVTYSNYNLYSIWLSEDAGKNWQKVAGNLEANSSGGGSGPSIRWLSILPFPDGSRKYFCATSVGLYSADSLSLHSPTKPGTQWKLEAPDVIGNAVVDYIDVRPADGLVAVATHGNGAFSANFMPASGSHEPVQVAEVRVSPNPAIDVVTFSVSGVVNSSVGLRLFDLNGRLVRNTSWYGPSGQVDVGDLSSGVYVYELRGPGWRKSGKVVRQ